MYEKSSKREFDGKIKAWRRALHKWDEPHILKSNPIVSLDENADSSGNPVEEIKGDDRKINEGVSSFCQSCYGHPCVCDDLEWRAQSPKNTHIVSGNGEIDGIKVPYVTIGAPVLPSYDFEEDEDDVL